MYTKWSGILLGLIVGAAIAVRCYGIADRTFWFDEAFSHRLISDFSWPEMIERTGRDVHPPFFYVALRLWACLFGDGIVTLRLFSVFMAALTIIGVYQLVFDASRCGSHGLDPQRSRAAGLAATAFVASTPLHIYWSQEARMYTLGTALVVWSSWCLLRALQRDDRRWYALYVLTAAALMYTHNYGLFTVLGQGVFVAAYFVCQGPQALASRRFGKAAAALAVAGGAYLPWLPVLVAQKQRVSAEYWISQLNWWTVPDACQELLFPVNAATVPDHLLSLLCAAVAIVTVACLARRPSMGSGLLIALVVVPVLASVGVSLVSVPIVHSRYYQFAYVAAVCGFAILLFRSVPRRGATIMSAALVVCALIYTDYFYRHELEVHARPGIRGAVQYLRQNMHEGDVIVVTHPCIYYSVRRYMRDEATPWLFLDGEIPSHYMGAPILTPADLIGSEELASLEPTTLWVVTTTGYGQNWRMQGLPTQWRQDYGTLREFREVSFFQGSIHIYQCRKLEDVRVVSTRSKR